jgi:hypothetical protein
MIWGLISGNKGYGLSNFERGNKSDCPFILKAKNHLTLGVKNQNIKAKHYALTLTYHSFRRDLLKVALLLHINILLSI